MEDPSLEKLIEIYCSHLNKSKEIHCFRIYNLFTSLIIEKIPEKRIEEILDNYDEPAAHYKIYLKILDEMNSHERKYESINAEVAYKLYFQNFEEFLSEMIYWCMYNFPKYIINDDSKNEILLEKIFGESTSIDDIKDYVLSFRVKKIMQSNNIVESLSKFEKLFSFKFPIEKNQIEKLFQSALNRNILTHNAGKINEIYLAQLSSRKLTSNLKKGENIANEHILKIIDQDEENLSSIASIIFESIQNDIKRLESHHNNL